MRLIIILDKRSHIAHVVNALKLNDFKISKEFIVGYRGKGKTYIGISEERVVRWGLTEWLKHSGGDRKEISSTEFLEGMEE